MPQFSHEELEEIFGIKFVDRGQEPLDAASKKFKEMAAAEMEAVKASTGLSEETQKLDTSLKKAIGDNESSGLKGIAANALKAEKALSAVISGKGLPKAAGAIEGLLEAVGAPAGLGMASIAIEIFERKIIPLLEKTFAPLAENTKKQEEAIRKLHEAVDKLAIPPTEKAEHAAAAGFLEGGPARELRGKLIGHFREAREGLTAEERTQLQWLDLHATEPVPRGKMGEWFRAQKAKGEAIQAKLFANASEHTDRIIDELSKASEAAQAEVSRELGQYGQQMMARLQKRIENARRKRHEQLDREELEEQGFESTMKADEAFQQRIATPQQKLHAELRREMEAENQRNIQAGGTAATEAFLEGATHHAEQLVGEGMKKAEAIQRAIAEQQLAFERKAENLEKENERMAVRKGMRQAGVWGTPEFRHRVEEDALKALPFTAGDIMRAVNIGYREAIHQLRQEAHRTNKVLGNTFQQQGSPW